MMDCVVPGGVAVDLDAAGVAAIRGAWSRSRAGVSAAGRALRQHRLAAGPHGGHRRRAPTLARAIRRRRLCRPRLGPRLRRAARAAYPPYDALDFEVPVLDEGDVNARRLDPHSGGRAVPRADRADPRRGCRAGRSPHAASRGGAAKGIGAGRRLPRRRLVWLRLDADGRVARCHLRDPSWFQWPLLEAAIEGNIVADFPLCNKSFNCSYSGHDL